MIDWDEIDRLKQNHSYSQISQITGVSVDTIKTHYRARTQEKQPKIQVDILPLLQKEVPIKNVCQKLNITERMFRAAIDDLKDCGYSFFEENNFISLSKDPDFQSHVYKCNWSGESIIRKALIGDTHLCSVSQQLTHLNKFYDICESEGIPEVLHVGDLLDGDDVYPGHRFEVFKVGSDAQKEYAVQNYPKRKNMKTKFIGGNHDLKWFAKSGYDVCKAIAKERLDLEYLGQYYSEVMLTDKCSLRLEHPLGKPAYAVSYKTQRKIDNMRGGEKPNILVEGHFHYHVNFFRRNVHAFCVPSFQGPTKFSNRLGLENENGGYIIEIHVDEEGTITRLKSEFIPFYKVIKNDY